MAISAKVTDQLVTESGTTVTVMELSPFSHLENTDATIEAGIACQHYGVVIVPDGAAQSTLVTFTQHGAENINAPVSVLRKLSKGDKFPITEYVIHVTDSIWVNGDLAGTYLGYNSMVSINMLNLTENKNIVASIADCLYPDFVEYIVLPGIDGIDIRIPYLKTVTIGAVKSADGANGYISSIYRGDDGADTFEARLYEYNGQYIVLMADPLVGIRYIFGEIN